MRRRRHPLQPRLRRRPPTPPPDTAASGGTSKIGFITKFPVDFYDTMVDAAKAWNEDHPEVELIFAQGASGTDDEGEISAIESMVTQGVKAIVDHADEPERAGRTAEGGRRGHQGDPRRQRHPRLGRQDRRSSPPTTWPAACWPASSWPSSSSPATPSPSSKASPARRRCSTGSTGFKEGLGDGLRDRRLAADRLRPDQGPRRRPGHPHRQPRRDGDLRRLRPADHRRHRGDQERRQDHQGGRFRRRPRRGGGDRGRRRARLGRPVPGQDGRDRGTGGARRHQRRGRRAASTRAPRWSPRTTPPSSAADSRHRRTLAAPLGGPPTSPTASGPMTRISALDVIDVRFPTSRGSGRVGRDEPRARLLRRLRRAAHRRSRRRRVLAALHDRAGQRRRLRRRAGAGALRRRAGRGRPGRRRRRAGPRH